MIILNCKLAKRNKIFYALSTDNIVLTHILINTIDRSDTIDENLFVKNQIRDSYDNLSK